MSSAIVGPGAGAGNGKCVLVVDPDADTRTILATALNAAGHRPLVASDVQGAFVLAASARIDLVITEARALGTPDLPAALRASPELASVPMLVYSTRAFPGDVERALLAGASEVVLKPVPYRTIIALVEKLTAPPESPPPPPPLTPPENGSRPQA